MKSVLFSFFALLLAFTVSYPANAHENHNHEDHKAENSSSCSSLLNHSFRRLASDKSEKLCETYKGKVLLIVNTASKCGNTKQYETLESMYEQYKDRGFSVLGFPSNDFAGQEPGSEKEIESFCRLTYKVKFPMFEKSSVKAGESINPLYQALATKSGEYPAWNFHKYLIDANGELIDVYSPGTKPDAPQIIQAIETALKPTKI